MEEKEVQKVQEQEVQEEHIVEEGQGEDNKKKVLEEENKKLKETLMRTLAELDNTRKRAEKEKQDTAQYAIGKFANDLINVRENFEVAFVSIDESKIEKNFLEGIRLTHNELKKVFERNGLVRIFPLNEDFNPLFHNAITQIESDLEEGKVAQVMQAGYSLNDRVLRPALVGVSKKKES
jgi:molecular chaperone GrpE